MESSELMTHVFPDTDHGAISYLTLETQGAIDLKECYAKPDPWVYGVWQVFTPSDSEVEYAIVYLAGYDQPNGETRARNDFESFYREGVV